MNSYFDETEIRKDICVVGQKLYDKEFVAANDGNISVKINDHEIIITPTGVSKGGMIPEELIKIDLNGKLISGKSMPSSEVKMHLKVYQLNPEVKAVVHAHPPLATAFAVARIPLDRPILSEAVVNLGVVPVADYALPGTDEVPNSIVPFVKEYNAVLLANHGLLTWGSDLTQAYFRMESVEHYCKILYYLKQIGEPKEFNFDQVSALLDIREKMGIYSGGTPSCKEDYINTLD
ncbi:MAG: class II aldolase family protein [Firmicutes bacterium HGW-Firmicutes-7]|nr:MAG: class II aldolase family protein [Firmicutes bacterium HGW-Firmicutes-7]